MKLGKEHPEGIALRAWVSTQHMEDMDQLYTWNESLFQTCTESTSYYLHSRDKDKNYLSTNSVLGLLMLWKYLHHNVQESQVYDSEFGEYAILEPEYFCNITYKEFMVWRLNESSINNNVSSTPRKSSSMSTKQDETQLELSNFKRGMKRDVSHYTPLKDEKYFEAYKRDLEATAASHLCSEILDEHYSPPLDSASRELYELKQQVMYSVFNKTLLTNIGKNIVRKYRFSMDAQSVWKDFEKAMSKSAKGDNERRRLHSYISNIVYDSSWRGTTETFVLHFHEQLRQLDELTPLDEQLPASTRLAYLKNAVSTLDSLNVVETYERVIKMTNPDSSEMDYDTYFDLLIDTCVIHDKKNKSKPSRTSRAVYQHEIEEDDNHSSYIDIDDINDEIYQVNATNINRKPPMLSPAHRRPHSNNNNRSNNNSNYKDNSKPKYNGPIYLPKEIYNMLSEEAKKSLDKYNKERIKEFHERNKRVVKQHVQENDDNDADSEHETDLQPEEEHPILMDDDEIENLIDTYSIKVAITYNISQHSASSYGSLIDRGANGGFAGADVRVLERTGSRSLSLELVIMNYQD